VGDGLTPRAAGTGSDSAGASTRSIPADAATSRLRSAGDPGGGGLPAVLGIDGGNSKTDAALVAADGTVLAAIRGGGTRGATDLTGSLRLIAGLAGELQQAAGLTGRPVARHMSACMANVDLPEEEERLAGALRPEGLTLTTEVVNDTFAVLRAGLPGGHRWGVAVTCGAGINCVGVAPDGQTTRYLSLGTISGDWGGGHGLGLAALWWAVRAEDGRGPQTALAAAVAGHFGVPAARDVTIGLHYRTIDEHDLRGLAPVVLATARDGDEVARGLVRRQAEEICVMALTAMRRLHLTTRAVPVVLGGGVLAAGDPLLTAEIASGLAAAAPLATMHIVDVPPVVGAALLGLDHIGGGPAAEHRLRAVYDEPVTGPGPAARSALQSPAAESPAARLPGGVSCAEGGR
jgi:N-acetylglucosamine kinase-like BadF-type ATPase